MTQPPGIPGAGAAAGGHGQGNLDTARENLAKADQGGPSSAEAVDDLERSDPATAEAAEQEASDGPQGRGLSR